MAAAQNQHYVPRFILRQFLSDVEKEHVSVYDKHEDKIFVTAIKNIMAERRFHDFAIEEWTASFEPVASRIEEIVLPVYRKVVEARRLDGSPETRAALALLMAFQFTRTRAHREIRESLEEALRAKVEAMGRRMQDVEGWEEPTEDIVKREHLRGAVESVDEFARIIARKDFLLAEAGAGRRFYLGDHPVSMHNSRKFGSYGNLGLALPGIELYMPLSADLQLCAWCPSILREIADHRAQTIADYESETLAAVMAGRMQASQMKAVLDNVRAQFTNAAELLKHVTEGTPISSTSENMDHYNSLQSMFAYRYIVSQDGDFDLARRHNAEFPKHREGLRPTMD